MDFVVTVLAHKPITTLTPLYLAGWTTRVAWLHPIASHRCQCLFFYSWYFS